MPHTKKRLLFNQSHLLFKKTEEKKLFRRPLYIPIVNKLHGTVNIFIFRICYGQLRSMSKDLF